MDVQRLRWYVGEAVRQGRKLGVVTPNAYREVKPISVSFHGELKRHVLVGIGSSTPVSAIQRVEIV